MRLNLYTLPIFLVLVTVVSAQKNIDPTTEHIAHAKNLKKIYPKDDMVILKSNEQISFGIDKKTSLVTVDRKVDEELMNISPRADILKYEFYNSFSKIVDFDVRYRNKRSAGLTIKDEFYEDDDIFYHDARVKYTHIDFPVMGYKHLYHLRKRYDDVKYFTQVMLNSEHPIIEKKVSFNIPNWLNLELKEFNFEGYDISIDKKTNDKLDVTTYSYTIRNIDAIAKEKNTPGLTHTAPHILVIAKTASINGEEKTLFQSTQNLYDWYHSLITKLNDEPDAYREKVEELTKDAGSDIEKIENIYYWVQDNIRYIAFEDGIAGFKPETSQNVFKNRYGDCKGMANLTKQMLKLVGFDARLCWIGTKRIAYDYSLPSLAVDNHMICAVFLDGKTYFLDSTEKYNPFGEYAERIQNRPVMIENGDEFILDKIPQITAANNKETHVFNLDIVGETLKGSVTKKIKGESRTSFLYGYNSLKTNQKDNALQKFLAEEDKSCQISNIDFNDSQSRSADIDLSYDIELQNRISSFDNEIYIDIEYGEHYKNLDLAERKTDLEFPYKKDLEIVTTLTIPEGYAIKSTPESITKDNDDFLVELSFDKNQDKIEYKKHFLFKNSAISRENFEAWNELSSILKTIYQEQIVLTQQTSR